MRYLSKNKSLLVLAKTARPILLLKTGVLNQYPPRPLFIPEHYFTMGSVTTKEFPIISIVTPSFNQGEFIERTIRSVLGQNYPNTEYIIQDGKSNDNTIDVVKSFQEGIAHFESKSDHGQAHAINMGFQKSQGEIMAYLNSDDILLPGTLRYVADYFARHSEVDVIYGHRVIVNARDEEIGRWVLPAHNRKILHWGDYVPQETLFWRRNIWDKVGGFVDESFHFALDWELLLRFQFANANFKRLPRFLAAFRLHSGQKTSTHIDSTGLDEMNRLRRRIHGHDVSLKEIQRNINPYILGSLFQHIYYNLGILRY